MKSGRQVFGGEMGVQRRGFGHFEATGGNPPMMRAAREAGVLATNEQVIRISSISRAVALDREAHEMKDAEIRELRQQLAAMQAGLLAVADESQTSTKTKATTSQATPDLNDPLVRDQLTFGLVDELVTAQDPRSTELVGAGSASQ